MSKLNIDQQTVKQLFSDKKSDFLIPDYQRPYAWDEIECQTLWDDVFNFSFPNDDCDQFDSDNDEYFLGPIVTYKNDTGKLEIIDGQQRLTTLMLLLRAFYTKFENMHDKNSVNIRETISKCIWKTDEFDNLKMDELKIASEVSSDDDKEEFLALLKTGEDKKEYKSQYAENYRFFKEKIQYFTDHYPSWCAYLPARIMNNCILLPIEAESQDTALRIFSTLNDRGKPLSDSDIFKAQFYKYYADKGEKDKFIKRWKELEDTCNKLFYPQKGTPMDDLFTRYMYYERAKQGNRNTTTEALRKFYERDGYALLKKDETFNNLELLAQFWKDIIYQEDSFSKRVQKKLFVLNYAPNSMWQYVVSVYFMHNKNAAGNLDEELFYAFLDKITGFIFAYAFTHPGVNALRTPVYPELINIVNGEPVMFKDFRFEEEGLRNALENYVFGNQRPITRSMLTWWAYRNDAQELFDWEEALEIEHIFPRKRQENESALEDSRSLEALGNKALLEKRINIRASDYRFEDKKKYYTGFTTDKGKVKEATKNDELIIMAKGMDDFAETDIKKRTKDIFDGFINYLADNDLIL